MPCYDKKLEAAREDFVFQAEPQSETHENGLSIPEVDSVLTTGEVLELIQVRFNVHLHYYSACSNNSHLYILIFCGQFL